MIHLNNLFTTNINFPSASSSLKGKTATDLSKSDDSKRREPNPPKKTADKTGNADTQKETRPSAVKPETVNGHELSNQELKMLQELRSRDREVKAHEQAHIAAGGRYVRSGASYKYQQGPDGRKYAVGGEVSIDTSEEKDPKATIRKMDTVIKAALAPSKPSAKDRAVAAMARVKKAKAQMQLAKEERIAESDKETNGLINQPNKKEKIPAEKNIPGTIINTYA